jgi:hypothetical protein
MSDGYTPPRNSTAEKVLAHLATHPDPLTAHEIANLCGCKNTSVGKNLQAAIDAGALVREKAGRLGMVYALPGEPGETPPRDGKLTIACWSDGDIAVRGGVVCADDSVTYTREQVQQLINHVTKPHIAPATPAASQEY